MNIVDISFLILVLFSFAYIIGYNDTSNNTTTPTPTPKKSIIGFWKFADHVDVKSIVMARIIEIKKLAKENCKNTNEETCSKSIILEIVDKGVVYTEIFVFDEKNNNYVLTKDSVGTMIMNLNADDTLSMKPGNFILTRVSGYPPTIPESSTEKPLQPSKKSYFIAGKGGRAAFTNDTSGFQEVCGGGGAGGLIFVKNNIPILPTDKATQGEVNRKINDVEINGLDANPPTGLGGEGFGAGGGGAKFNIGGANPLGGRGADGFVYLIEDDAFITTDQIYKAKRTKYNAIAIGGGGAGGIGNNGFFGGFTGTGGSAGNVSNSIIPDVDIGSDIKITIGKGGVCDGTKKPPTSSNGGDTIVSVYNSISKKDDILLDAKGGISGGGVTGPVDLELIRSPSKGGAGVWDETTDTSVTLSKQRKPQDGGQFPKDSIDSLNLNIINI